ncbi:MAG: sigma-70 family RNA polymerase sigma factor [Alkalibacterium sp.]|uniref:Sigma-70 region 2 n=1 Tax=Alkalibacterium gilvum TaxID=1130080 RepID=A0A1H6SUP6_9LACT|nr:MULTISPECIES: sigma-70 family RNA polymerase sigma factor [Alkalibacterium]MDN6296000.1 sigma-70 family RNA polymerase sigma factor [Alkalibacterium sp.]MDN6398188.1 sigma-70 family RNA polymerase sigma factor [Alkalibacterium sp.]MDN6729094.1 sigma-70 family RNA polymerase sigma factor [Alkalibacterium sp.]SEI67675.1 Sigma-70 region 2 [Alkalibacterium gilvum]HAJ70356.1 sigma-70 family RNA polymerase sigma factor [Alkalibacterium sp.]
MKDNQENEKMIQKKVFKDISDPVIDEFIQLFQSGDRTVFPEIIERSERLLKKAVYRRFIKGYEQDDLYQEACLILVESIKKFNPSKGMSFNQFFSLSLDNHFKGLIRRNNALKRKSFKESLSLEGTLEEKGYQLMAETGSIQPEDQPIVNETMEEYIRYLSDFEKEVCLYCYLGYPFDMIADKLRCTKKQVMNAKHRCTDKYRQHFL